MLLNSLWGIVCNDHSIGFLHSLRQFGNFFLGYEEYRDHRVGGVIFIEERLESADIHVSDGYNHALIFFQLTDNLLTCGCGIICRQTNGLNVDMLGKLIDKWHECCRTIAHIEYCHLSFAGVYRQ